MTARRSDFSLVCLPPDEGGLIAIGGYNNRGHIDVVECLDGEAANDWRLLAPLPLPYHSRGGVYFKHRILLFGRYRRCNKHDTDLLLFNPPTTGGLGQWVILKPKLPYPEFPVHICGNSLFLISKLTFLYYPNFLASSIQIR